VRDFKALTAAAAAALAALDVCWTSAAVIGRRRIPRIRQCDTIESLAAEPIGQGGRLGRAVARPLCVRNEQELLLALPLFCIQIDFSAILY